MLLAHEMFAQRSGGTEKVTLELYPRAAMDRAMERAACNVRRYIKALYTGRSQ